MSVYLQLAQAMFPHITKTPEDYEAQYPPRSLPDGARVTRIAPSPPAICIWVLSSPPWSTA